MHVRRIKDGVFFTYSVLEIFEIKHKSPFHFYLRSCGHVPTENKTQVAYNECSEKWLLFYEMFLNGAKRCRFAVWHPALYPSNKVGLELNTPFLGCWQSSNLSTYPSGRSERGLEELHGDMGGRNTPAVNLNGAALQESRTLLLYLASPWEILLGRSICFIWCSAHHPLKDSILQPAITKGSTKGDNLSPI